MQKHNAKLTPLILERDWLSGGTGNDTLIGSDGKDVLMGGDGERTC